MSRHTVWVHTKRLAELGYLFKERIMKTARTGRDYISAVYHKIAEKFRMPKEYETVHSLVQEFLTRHKLKRSLEKPAQEGT